MAENKELPKILQKLIQESNSFDHPIDDGDSSGDSAPPSPIGSPRMTPRESAVQTRMEMWEDEDQDPEEKNNTPRPQTALRPSTPMSMNEEKGVSEEKLRSYIDEIKGPLDIKVVMAKVFEEIEDDEAFQNTISRIETIFEPDDFEFSIAPPKPVVPDLSESMGVRRKIKKFQNYINSFQYNHIGREFCHINKNKPASSVSEVGRLIIKRSWPIKCLETIALGVLLTKDMKDVVRFPIRFKSKVDGHTYWHIILGLKYNNKFGCLGLSRRYTLAGRDLKFDKLDVLVQSYIEAYEEVGHKVRKMTVGLPISHNTSSNFISWHFLKIPIPKKTDWPAAFETIEEFGKQIQKIQEHVLRSGNLGCPLPNTLWQPDTCECLFIPPSRAAKMNKDSPIRGGGIKAITKLKARRASDTSGSPKARKKSKKAKRKDKQKDVKTSNRNGDGRAALGV